MGPMLNPSCKWAVLDFSKKCNCTCACNFKKLHAQNLVYIHMMSMMKYMHKIYVVLQAVVIPAMSLLAFQVSTGSADVLGNASSPALWDRDSTFSSCCGWADSYVFLSSSSFSATFPSLSLLDTRLKCYFLSICCAHHLTLWNKWLKTYMHMCM